MSSEGCFEVQFRRQYEVEETVHFVLQNHFEKVCLQFPDHLLSDAPQVVDELGKHTKAEFYVLGDTAYAPCCVDIIAAQHVAADAIVHYGHACLSPTRDLPVFYVFEKKNLLHMDNLVRFMKEKTASHLVVLFESYYGHLESFLTSFLELHVKEKTIVPVHFRKSSDTLESTEQSETHTKKYLIGHLEFELPFNVPSEQFQFVWLGNPDSSSFLRASLSLYPLAMDCYDDTMNRWVPANQGVTSTLKKRFALISKARSCHVFGIVVSAIASVGILDAVERCETLLNKFQMEWYLLNVGKPTPTKLANFPEIEVFIFIGCPERAFLDSKIYMKPVLTLAELELALDFSLYYSDIGSIHDFNDTLSRPVVAKKQGLEDDADDDCNQNLAEYDASNALNRLSLDRDLITYDIASSSAAAFMKSRSWKGVEEEPNEDNEPHASKEGRYGIPSGYNNEDSFSPF